MTMKWKNMKCNNYLILFLTETILFLFNKYNFYFIF